MNKPWVNYPANNPQTGEQHRTVSIRHGGQCVSIKCRSRSVADALGRALVGVFNRHLDGKMLAIRTHTCIRCGNQWEAPVGHPQATSNLSGEATPWCPGCGTKEVLSSPIEMKSSP